MKKILVHKNKHSYYLIHHKDVFFITRNDNGTSIWFFIEIDFEKYKSDVLVRNDEVALHRADYIQAKQQALKYVALL